MKDFTKWWPILLAGLLLFAFMFMMREATPPAPRPAEVAYSEFKQLLRDKRVDRINLADSSATATVKPAGGDLGWPRWSVSVSICRLSTTRS